MSFEELEIFNAYQFEYFKTTKDYERAYSFWKTNNPEMSSKDIDEYIYEGLLQRYSREMFDNKLW